MTKKISYLFMEIAVSIKADLHSTTVVHDLYPGKYDQMHRNVVS